MFTVNDIQTLRERTGVGMMDCKKALTETDGNIEKAIEYLREKGMAGAAKRAGRIAAEGIVNSCHLGDQAGVLLEVNCETDFVAKSDKFNLLVCDLALHIAKEKPEEETVLMEQKFVKDPAKTITQVVNEAIASTGEKISIRRFTRYEIGKEAKGIVDSYIHLGGKVGVLLEVNCETESIAKNDKFKQLVHDISLHIAAAKPEVVRVEDMSKDKIETEKKILREQAKNEPKPKPEAVIEKMVEGRIKKFLEESVLMEQKFVKDQDKTITQIINDTIASIGEKISIKRFTRYEMGEGIEKRKENLADEIEKMKG